MALYNQSWSFPYDNGGYYNNHIPYESGYYNHASYSYYPPPQSSAGLYSYEYVPTQSLLIAYSACGDDVAYTHPGSVQYAVYHSVAAPPLDDDLNFIEYDPHPYGGGYDIDQTYGKPLPPSDEICYPPSSIALNLPTPAVVVPVVQEQEEEEEELPDKEEAEDLRIEAPETEEEEEEEESDASDEESEEDSVVEENNYGKVVDQIPPGYGLEAYDLCESLFGYWPCLSKMKTKKKCGECGNEISVGVGGDDVDEWKRTADYLFGNPDPYDQMQYQHQPTSALVLYEQADQYGQNSWFL